MKLLKKILFLFTITFLVAPFTLTAAELKITLNGFETTDGFFRLRIATKEKAFMLDKGYDTKNVVYQVIGKVFQKKHSFSVDLPEGKYAFIAFHDEDANEKVTTNLLGIPKEGVGASNNAKGSFGPPKFKDALFSLVEGKVTEQVVEMQ